MFEEDKPKPVQRIIGGDLSALSVADLEAFVAELQTEIDRVQKDIAAKKKALGGAESLFKR